MISQFSGHKSGQLQLTAFIVPRKVLSTLTDGAIVKANCVTICTVNLVDLASGVAEPANAVEARQNQLRFFVRITPVYSTSRVILRGYQGHPSSNSGGGGVGTPSYNLVGAWRYAGSIYAIYSPGSTPMSQLGSGTYDAWIITGLPPQRSSGIDIAGIGRQTNFDVAQQVQNLQRDYGAELAAAENMMANYSNFVGQWDSGVGRRYLVFRGANTSSSIPAVSLPTLSSTERYSVYVSQNFGTPSQIDANTITLQGFAPVPAGDSGLWPSFRSWITSQNALHSTSPVIPVTPSMIESVYRNPRDGRVYAVLDGDTIRLTHYGRDFDIWRVDLTPGTKLSSSQADSAFPGGSIPSHYSLVHTSHYSRYSIPTSVPDPDTSNFNAETISTSTNPYAPLRFQYIQAIIRVTGHASDVRVRIEERIPLRPTFAVPENAIHTAGTLCKLLTADNAGVGTNYEPSLLPTGLPSKWLSYLDQECNVYQ